MRIQYKSVSRTLRLSKLVFLVVLITAPTYYAWKFYLDLWRVMRYTIFDSLHIENATILRRAARRFDCEKTKLLEAYKLSDKYKVGDVDAELPEAIAIAGNEVFFPSIKAVIADIHSTFAKDKIQALPRIIFYDLGGISEDKAKKMELMQVCNLEFRVFDWKIVPESLHKLKIFTWKVLIMAEMYREFRSFMYVDTSISFVDPPQMSSQFYWKRPNWAPDDRFQIYTRLYREKLISSVSFTHEAEHGVRFATHPDTYLYIPLHPSYDVVHDIEMIEAGFSIIHKSEMTRQFLKWAVLCATTRDCIEPEGALIDCYQEHEVAPASCHRQDQSVLNILLHNFEMTMLTQGSKIILHQSPYGHPCRYYHGHVVKRRQTTIKKLYQCAKEEIKKESS